MYSAIILACVLTLVRCQNDASEEYFSDYDENIVGGWNIDINDAPYQVSVRLNDRHHCGGSIVAQDNILTTAHCTNGRSYTNLGVRVGSSLHYKGNYFSLRKYEQHLSFNSETLEYDVSVLYLSKALTFGPTIKWIKFAESRPNVGTRLLVTGWGDTTANQGNTPDKLQALSVPLLSQSDCRSYYPNSISNDMLCAGYRGVGSCYGDSGGPSVDREKKVQVGVVSWGRDCGVTGYPGVYASVPNIFKNMQEYMLEDTQLEDLMEEDSQSTYT